MALIHKKADLNLKKNLQSAWLMRKDLLLRLAINQPVIDVIGQEILCIPYVHKVDEFKEIYEKLSVVHSDERSVCICRGQES